VSRLSRRSFLTWLGGLTAAAGLGTRRFPADARVPAAPSRAEPEATSAPALVIAVLTKIADVVLPSDLGADGSARIARTFNGWIADFRPHAELVHPYGNPVLRYTGASPSPKWRQQLEALDESARAEHGRSFVALPKAQREAAIRAAIANERVDRMRDPIAANHVVIALIGYYFTSPDAADLCYDAQIAKNQCRPLVNSSRQPVTLKRRGKA